MGWIEKIMRRLLVATPAPKALWPATACYAALVRTARLPWLFTQGGVADAPQARLELLLLFTSFALQRLRADTTFCQNLFDLLFVDVDTSLRELGVGDTGVAKRVKSWSEALHGRAAAYGAAQNEAELSAAIARNFGSAVMADLLARAAWQFKLQLATLSDETVRAGQWTMPAAITSEAA